MTRVRRGLACMACLLAGVVLGQRSFTPVLTLRADDFPEVAPAVANPPPERLPATTAAEHLRLAAEHLDAAGQSALAQHVRELAGKTATSATPYGPLRALPADAVPPSAWVPRPVMPPRGRVSLEVPPELDDGHMRYIKPVGQKFAPAETRTTTAAPPRGPI